MFLNICQLGFTSARLYSQYYPCGYMKKKREMIKKIWQENNLGKLLRKSPEKKVSFNARPKVI